MKKMCWESILVKNIVDWTSGQDGGAGKHGLPPCTTTAKIPLLYKTNITQNHKEIQLCGNLTTKELKKSHSFRQVGGAETWRWGEMCMEAWRQETWNWLSCTPCGG